LLAAALLDSLFAHPAWLFSVVPNLDICDGYRSQNEFFRSLLGEKIRMEALSYQQAEDDLAKAVLIICYHFEKSNAHRFWSRRTHYGCPNLNRFFIGSRFDDQLDKRALRQGCRRLERATSHGDIRHAIVHPPGVLCEKVGPERHGQSFVLPAIRDRGLGWTLSPIDTKACGAELAPE
jgi:hypothetical protein